MAAKFHLVGLMALAALVTAGACNGKTTENGPSVGSETNWLGDCSQDQPCAEGQCICGICTAQCTSDADCGSGGAQCVTPDGTVYQAACSEATSAPSGVCVEGCNSDADCGDGMLCLAGGCVPQTTGDVTQALSNEFFAAELAPGSADGPMCLPMALPLDDNGQLHCAVTEVLPKASCDCTVAGKHPASAELARITMDRFESTGHCNGASIGDPSATTLCADYCVCELEQESNVGLSTCISGGETAGWCYVDPAAGQGDPSLIASCPEYWQQALLLPSTSPETFHALTCLNTTRNDISTPRSQEPVGGPCVPARESDPQFGEFETNGVTVDVGSPECGSNLCLVNHFRGRVTCPYGNQQGTDCTTPQGDLVTGYVSAQLFERQSSDSVYCSCRCDGPAGTGPFCECPTGFECTELIPNALPDSSSVAGSYCVKSGTVVNDPKAISQTECQPPQCGPI